MRSAAFKAAARSSDTLFRARLVRALLTQEKPTSNGSGYSSRGYPEDWRIDRKRSLPPGGFVISGRFGRSGFRHPGRRDASGPRLDGRTGAAARQTAAARSLRRRTWRYPTRLASDRGATPVHRGLRGRNRVVRGLELAGPWVGRGMVLLNLLPIACQIRFRCKKPRSRPFCAR